MICGFFCILKGEEFSLHIDGRGFVGKGREEMLHFGEKLGEGCALRGRQFDSFPFWSRIATYLGKESLNPSPCEEGFVGRDIYSYAFRGEEKLKLLPIVGKDLRGKIAVHIKGKNPKLFSIVGRICVEG